MSELPKKLNFPKSFLWGAATAAHQVEGGNHNQWTVWELENAQATAKNVGLHHDWYIDWELVKKDATDPGNYVSAGLADHYNRYQEDFDLLNATNMNAFRFSVEWSRIEPQEGVWNAEAIGHYNDYVKELKRRGIEPIVTLFHFTLPVWFSEKGGFTRRSNVKYFTRFAKKIASELGDSVKYIITINEPEVYAVQSYYMGEWPPSEHSIFKWWRVVNNLSYAHRQVAKSIHKLDKRFKVSIAKNSNYFYAGDDSWLSKFSAVVMQFIEDDFYIRKVVKHCDFLGVNYYFSNRVYGMKIHNPDRRLSDLHWDLQPSDIQYVLERLYKRYKLPIIITENGLADSRDINRQWWISETIIGMQKAIKNGVKLKGYLHWSLIDNFEWAYGKWPRFGLTEVNYQTGGRKLRPSAIWFGKVIDKIRDR